MKTILKLIGVLLLAVVIYFAYAIMNPTSPLDRVTFENNELTFEVEYSRPFKKDRLIFGDKSEGALVPFGEYWRTGANAATNFSISSDITISGIRLMAGKYRLYTVPGENKWEVFINSESDTFFAITEPDSDKDLMNFTINSQKLNEAVEQFTIDFIPSPTDGPSSTGLRLRWDLTEIVIPFN
jgi:hypothetical protein